MNAETNARLLEVGTPDRTAGDIHRATYKYLRWSMIVLALTLILVALFVSQFTSLPFEGSLSAYYGQPVRDVFVGVLVATGACMVVYQGASLLEDYLLNMSGVYAIFVALIPTTLTTDLAKLGTRQEKVDTVQSIQISLWFVMAIGLGVTIYELTRPGRLVKLRDNTSVGAKVIMFTTTVILLAFVVLLVIRCLESTVTSPFMGLGFGPDWMQKLRVHDYAAILLIVNLALAVFSHAWPDVTGTQGSELTRDDKDWKNVYRAIFLFMLSGLFIALLAQIPGWKYTVIFLEVWQIGAFILFWFFETLRVGKNSETATVSA